MSKESNCIDDFINGNIADAKRQAKGIKFERFYDVLVEEYGKDSEAAVAIARYLKNPSRQTWQAACDAMNM